MSSIKCVVIFLGAVALFATPSHAYATRSFASGSLSSLLLLSIASPLPLFFAIAAKTKQTYYEVLGLTQDASLQDIKKAYRKLAVQHHPDRNIGNEEDATVKFREIGEAYEVLSDEKSRKQYDKMLKYGGSDAEDGGYTFNWSTGGGGSRDRREFKHRDPFAQFNDVFKNDPFFAEARKSMNDLFDKHFSSFASETNKKDENTGGFWNTLKQFMPDINIESEVTMGESTSRTSRSYSNNRKRGGGGSRSTYTSRSTSTTIENGKRVVVQTLEKDGNRIEEKYVGDTLIERKINGLKQDIGRIDQGEF